MIERPFTVSNPRNEDQIADWPIGRQKRATAVFLTTTNKRGQRLERVTTGKPKCSTYYKAIRLVDGSDGRTYFIGLANEYPGIYVMSCDMKTSCFTVNTNDEDWDTFYDLFN